VQILKATNELHPTSGGRALPTVLLPRELTTTVAVRLQAVRLPAAPRDTTRVAAVTAAREL
jgi:hypothetical protein